ncbi:MAG: exo-alpha-sialidase, partial [Clostridiales bacterium]|nr:exo-alpha-sialidase [Clostridiales bacterium]
LVLAFSDGGMKFSEPVILENAPKTGYCYPAVHYLPDAILLAYCAGSESDGGCLNRIAIRKLPL